jgi:transketolase
MNFNPNDAKWLNRDRLVLSSGHGSMFLYSFLHLLKYDVSLDDIKSFRQLNSKTPGHPEFGHTSGVECTTGPLGQGISNAVGISLSEAHLSSRFNSEKHKIFDHYTFCLCGDGDLMEGIAMEAISFAGHQQLNKLICIYDYNSITIDGNTDIAYTDNVRLKLEAQNWNVLEIDGHNLTEIHNAIEQAKNLINLA